MCSSARFRLPYLLGVASLGLPGGQDDHGDGGEQDQGDPGHLGGGVRLVLLVALLLCVLLGCVILFQLVPTCVVVVCSASLEEEEEEEEWALLLLLLPPLEAFGAMLLFTCLPACLPVWR